MYRGYKTTSLLINRSCDPMEPGLFYYSVEVVVNFMIIRTIEDLNEMGQFLCLVTLPHFLFMNLDQLKLKFRFFCGCQLSKEAKIIADHGVKLEFEKGRFRAITIENNENI